MPLWETATNGSPGGIFKLELFLPDDYPMTPPKIRFLTKIFHPNVDKLGRICLDVLKSMAPQPCIGGWDNGTDGSSQTTGPPLFRSEPSCSRSRLFLERPTPMILSPPTLQRAGRRTSRPPSQQPRSGPRSTPRRHKQKNKKKSNKVFGMRQEFMSREYGRSVCWAEKDVATHQAAG